MSSRRYSPEYWRWAAKTPGMHSPLVSCELADKLRVAFSDANYGRNVMVPAPVPGPYDMPEIPDPINDVLFMNLRNEAWHATRCVGLAPWTGQMPFHYEWKLIECNHGGKWITTEVQQVPYFTSPWGQEYGVTS